MKTSFTFFHLFVALIVLCCNTTHGKTCKTVIPEQHPASNVYLDPSITGFPGIPETSISAFQLISHGRPGQLLLHGKWMNAAQIAVFIAPELNSSDAKIQHLNIYGCEFGKGETGKAAVTYLEKALGVSVSASDDITGKDGDWDLEVGTYVSIMGLGSYNGNLQSISGTINSYAAVTNISGTTFTVDVTTGFAAGQKILVIQMQGAVINTSNTSHYGELVDLNGAGNYEFVTVASVTSTTVTISGPLTKTYDATGSVQLITVPVYTGTTTVSASLTGTAWNGTKGGVLVFEADQLVLNSDITMTGKGFIGGARATTSNNSTAYYSSSGASKGEGIAKFTVGNRLSGAQYNGGGGGNAVNTGGGGGANYGVGGKGGTYSLNTQLSGVGGYAVSCGLRVLIMGGGGGAGDENDNQGSAGANGGGIIMIKANSITGNSRIIESNGSTAANSQADGAGGGGGGGTLALLGSPSISGNLTINLKGGNGGTVVYVGAHGGGGGGGGGYLLRDASLPSTVTLDVSGGAGGSYTAAAPPPILAVDGQPGGVSTLSPVVPVIAASQVFQYVNGTLSGVSDPGNTVVDLVNPGTASSFNIDANNYVAISNSGQLSWIGTSVPSGDLILYVYPNGDISGCPVSITIQYNNDNDGDGVRDIDDIDDDNDGVPDAMESPGCFYTELETLTALKISSQFTNPDDSQNDGDLQVLHDGSTALTFNFNALTADQNPTGSNLFTIEYPTPVRLSAISVSNDISTTANANAVVVGSNDGITWSAALSPATLVTTTPVNFTVTVSQAYKYYRIRTGSVPGDLALANTIGEITATFSTNYIASYHPKPNCITDTDGDGTRNEYDLDSDGDGCSDAFEAGATTDATPGYAFISAVGTNGLADAKETTTDAGTINYASTYPQYATTNMLSLCADTDGDGVKDVVDIDDDNDGILDVMESPACFYSTSEAIVPVKISTGITTSTVNSVSVTPGNDIPTMHDGVITAVTASNHVVPANQLGNTSKIIYKVEYPVAIGLMQMDIYTSTQNWGTGSIAVLEASNDDVNYEAVSVPVSTGVASGMTKTWPVTLNTTNLYRYYRIRVSTAATTPLTFNNYEVVGTLNSATYMPSVNPKPVCTSDTDGDGIPNHLDLDSDGDGCPDTKEAILFTNPSVSTMAGTIKNGSGGAVTSTIPNVPDAIVPGPYGSNGFADAIQSLANPDAYRYVYTYKYIAAVAANNACADSDGDGIPDLSEDIDSDNDGIPNAVESPECFFTEQLASVITAPATSDFTWSATNPLTNTYDQNVSTYAQLTPAANILNKTLVAFDLPLVDPATLLSVSINVGAVAFGTGSWQLEGLNTSNVWIPISVAQVMNTANVTYTFADTMTTPFYSYRIKGISNVNATLNARLNEVTYIYKNFQPSQHTLPEGCNSDTDGDGVLNFLDRDSDGDGCPDAVEAGVSGILQSGTVYYPSGSIVVNNAVASGPYGDNGLADGVEMPLESGIITYISTYSQYAKNAFLNVCADTDGDGIKDLVDIDDDNDGILDAVESPACFYTETEMSHPASISTTFTIGAGDNVNTLADTILTGAFNFTAQALANDTILEFTVKFPATLDTVAIQMNATATSATNGFGAAGATAKIQGFNGAIWIDISAATNVAGTTLGRINFVITDIANKYTQYRIMGVAVANSNTNPIGELLLSTKSPHSSSMYPKPTCSTDTDNDGILNHLDLDSDGDKCPDAYEAGTYNKSGVTANSGMVQNGSGGAVASTVSTPNSLISGPYGGNGFADVLQAVADTNSYKYTYTYNIASDSTQKACCIASVTAPVLTKTSDTVCGLSSYNLNSIVSSTAPAYNAVHWFTDNLHTNLYATPVTAATGTYYAFYKDTINNCFSPVSTAFTVIAKPLPVGSASPQTICSGKTSGITLNSTISGSAYTWTAALQSGSVTGFSNCTSGCSNTIAQTLNGAGVVRYTVTPAANDCTGNTFMVDVTVSAVPTATIAYSGSPYPSGSGTANVTQTGQAGGTYSATPSGLNINTSNGQVNINSSFANTYTVKYVFSNGTCTDSITATVIIVPTNDTVTTTPTCPTCPVTVCAVVDDVDTTGGATYSTPCGTPAGYTASAVGSGGCITYTPSGTVTDTAQACIVTCNNGRCDTTMVILYPPVPTNDTVTTTPTCPTCPVVVCPVFDDVNSTAVTSVTTCSTPAGYTLSGPDVNHCYTYTPNGTATDTAEGCIIICDGNRCDTTRIIIYPPVQTINHDWNVGFTNMPVNGSVATNDQVYTNTTYSNIQANTNNPTVQTPVLNSSGTYTFTPALPGNYEFVISVCAPGQSTGCPTQLLWINVTDTAVNTTAIPIANPDMVTTSYQTWVGIPTLDNDASGNYGGSLNPSSVTITNMPNHGTIDSIGINGDVYYHPDAGFTGVDTLVYSVCDQLLPSNCDTAYQIIKVLPPGAANTTSASDDYANTLANTQVSGNVKGNDLDPEDNSLLVTPATVTNSNGSFVIDDQGAYTFTPAANFVGSAQYSYQVCDNGTPVACATATVYILVYPANTVPLPVKVIDFGGKALSNHSNLLTWKVTDVKDMDSYEIIRSTDQKGWISLGRITADNKDGIQSMQLVDNNPDKEDFYKLVLHGRNNVSETYPKVVLIRRNKGVDEWARLYPNPAETMVNLEYYSLEKDVIIQVDLMDVTGRRIKSIKHRLSEGSNVISINISGIADGMYNIRYTNTGNGRQENMKFIKKIK